MNAHEPSDESTDVTAPGVVSAQRELITSGPIVKAVFTLAIPVVLGMLMEVLLTVTDFFWVGKLGPAAQDAITSSMIVIWTIFSTGSLIGIGVTALVSRHIGAAEPIKAAFYIRQALWLSTIVGGTACVLGVIFAPAILSTMEASEATTAQAVPYLRIFLGSSLLLYWVETMYAVFRASGDTKTPAKISATVVVVNMILDPIMIFGLSPIPALGVPGAALATAIALLIGATLVARATSGGKLGYSTGSLFKERPDFAAMAKIARIGLPIASQQLTFVGVYWILIGYVHRFGETAGAAMGIGNRMESFSYLTCYGFSLAASTLVGQNLGANQPGRAARGAWGATGLGVGLTLVFTILFLTIPEAIASIFSDDPRVVSITVDYLIILGISQSAMAIEIILEGAFSGAGDTMPPMLVLLPGSLARIPLAWWLAFDQGWGINGIWWTVTITTGVKAIILAYWFRLGNWKRKKL